MNISWFEFIIAALCTYRISLMVVREKGPGHVFKKVREAPSKRSKIYDWLTCLFCFSMSASAFVCGCLMMAGTRLHYAVWFMLWCALSSVAILIHMQFNREEP